MSSASCSSQMAQSVAGDRRKLVPKMTSDEHRGTSKLGFSHTAAPQDRAATATELWSGRGIGTFRDH